jgi:hypothetical protein
MPHTLAIILASYVLEFIVHKQCIMRIQVKGMEFKSLMWVFSLPLTLTDRPASYKAADHRSRYLCRLQMEHKAPNLAPVTTHFVRAINI